MADVNRNTVQKEIVERVVCSSCDHPTAETIYKRAKEELPNISLGTVYRILKRLAADGIIQEIHVQNAPSVFDKTTVMHAHLLCESCGSVVDVFLDNEKFNSSVKDNCGHSLDNAQVLFNGICSHCLKKQGACKKA